YIGIVVRSAWRQLAPSDWLQCNRLGEPAIHSLQAVFNDKHGKVRMKKLNLLSFSALAGTAFIASAPAEAQQQAQGQQAQISAIEEIVVTSRRREENLQSVP